MRSLLRRGAVLLSTIALVAIPASAGELQWRSGRTPSAKPSSKTVSAHRFQRPNSTSSRVQSSVRPAAFEDEGPQFTSSATGDAALESVVVAREPSNNSLRSAQVPATDAGSQSPGAAEEPPADSQLEEQLRTPFGEFPSEPPPLQPPADQLDEGPMTLPADGRRTLPPDGAEQPRFEPPTEFQPIAPPGVLPAQPLPEAVPSPSLSVIEVEREKSQAACEESLENLRAKTIETLDLRISVSGNEGEDFPYECSLDEDAWYAGRAWPQTTYLWKASALCHKPLYFEDEQLERYGHSWPPCCQPFVSGAHFFTRLPVLPYCMGVEPPMECVYALGHYRPGSCAPYMCNPIPLSPRGAVLQAGAVVGAAAVLP